MAPSEEGPSASVGLGVGTADETTAAADALEPFDVADPIEMRRLALTIDALTALDPKTFDKDPMYRPIRRSLEPLNRRFADRHAAILEKERGKQLRREAEGRKARQAEMDRRHRDTTRLRLGRIERLRELERGASNGGAVGALLLPGSDSDGGCGDTDGRGDVSDATAATRYLSQVPDGAVKDLPRDALDAPSPSSAEELNKSKQCYTCKARFTKLHHFYAQLCPSCAGVNFEMRNFAADLTGKTALLTGARVKIGYEIGLKLLRAGACLIATTRFPADAARRYAAETDFEKFRSRLTVYSGRLEGRRGRGTLLRLPEGDAAEARYHREQRVPDGAKAGELLRAPAAVGEERGRGDEVGSERRGWGALQLGAAALGGREPSSVGGPVGIIGAYADVASHVH
jgi:hypothetical protein